MSGATHTPGPWTLEICEKSARAHIHGKRGDGNVRASDGLGLICTIKCATRETEDRAVFPEIDAEAEANARLMATAPDMLAALRYVETRCVSDAAYPHSSIEDRRMRDLVVSAIAKAEGHS